MVVNLVAFFYSKSRTVWNEHGKSEALACFDISEAVKRFATHNPLCPVANGKRAKCRQVAGMIEEVGVIT